MEFCFEFRRKRNGINQVSYMQASENVMNLIR